MVQEIKFNPEAISEIKKGVDMLANAVKVTLGPRGKNVIIEQELGKSPHITKDGVSVAKSINIENPWWNVGARLVKDVALKTCEDTGDGTTTATVLTQAIMERGLALLSDDVNISQFKRGMDMAVFKASELLLEASVPVKDDPQRIQQVATLSANNDPEIGKVVAEAINKATLDGMVTVEAGNSIDTYVTHTEGMQFDRGYISPYFVNNSENATCEMENPCILLYQGKISSIKEFLPFLEIISDSGKSLLIIAEDITDEALSALVINKVRANFPVCAVKAPNFGVFRDNIMEDIACLTGGKYIKLDLDIPLENIGLSYVGTAKKVIVSKNSTTIVQGAGNQEDINNRCESIKNEIAQTSTEAVYQEKLKERLAKLVGGISIIHVGATSEVELKERMDRIDDALCATRAAIEEGICPGGGSAYLKIQNMLRGIEVSNPSCLLGITCVADALSAPIMQLGKNSGIKLSEDVLDQIRYNKNLEYNFADFRLESMENSEIVDPTKVVRVALENAESVAGMFLTTECVITNKRSDIVIN